MIRQFGERKDNSQRYTPRPGAYAVLWNGSQVLLTYQEQPIPEVQLPGGGIDPGEAPTRASALRRGPPIETDHSVVWASPEEAAALLTNEGDRFYFCQALGL